MKIGFVAVAEGSRTAAVLGTHQERVAAVQGSHRMAVGQGSQSG